MVDVIEIIVITEITEDGIIIVMTIEAAGTILSTIHRLTESLTFIS